MGDYIIKVDNLTKKFGEKVILENVNLEFKRGESVAILGHNGAGKSTFIKMIAGLTSLSEGKVIVDKNIRFNYIPENYSGLNLTINQYLKCIGEIDNINKEEFNLRLNALYKNFYLDDMKHTPMKDLSKGSLQKVAVLQALISESDILLLDEPLSGQDVNSQRNFIDAIKELIAQGVTVIMSCHEPFLVEELSDRVLRIEDKKIVESELVEVKKEKTNILIFESNKNIDIKPILQLEEVSEYSEKQGKIKLEVKESSSNKVLLSMLNNGFKLIYFK